MISRQSHVFLYNAEIIVDITVKLHSGAIILGTIITLKCLGFEFLSPDKYKTYVLRSLLFAQILSYSPTGSSQHNSMTHYQMAEPILL